mgnify:CR=1 FL=1
MARSTWTLIVTAVHMLIKFRQYQQQHMQRAQHEAVQGRPKPWHTQYTPRSRHVKHKVSQGPHSSAQPSPPASVDRGMLENSSTHLNDMTRSTSFATDAAVCASW